MYKDARRDQRGADGKRAPSLDASSRASTPPSFFVTTSRPTETPSPIFFVTPCFSLNSLAALAVPVTALAVFSRILYSSSSFFTALAPVAHAAAAFVVTACSRFHLFTLEYAFAAIFPAPEHALPTPSRRVVPYAIAPAPTTALTGPSNANPAHAPTAAAPATTRAAAGVARLRLHRRLRARRPARDADERGVINRRLARRRL